MGQKDDYVGAEAQLKKGVLDLNFPVVHGVITNQDDMTRVWHHAFYHALKVAPEEHPLLLTEAPLNPRSNREFMAETMFETFYCPKLYVIIQSVLALYSSGYTSGLVVDSGDGLTFSIPIFEGAAITPAIRRLELGGRDLTTYLMKLISEKGYTLGTNSAGLDRAREIKERIGAVAYDFEAEMRAPSSQLEESYILPDGQEIKLGAERFKCPEAIFNPDLLGLEADGIDKMCISSIMKCGVDVRRNLYENILLCGGTTTFKGFVPRFEKSIRNLLPKTLGSASIRVNAPSNRLYSVWIGGSILASLSTFQQMWITRKEYDEVGSIVVSKKCF